VTIEAVVPIRQPSEEFVTALREELERAEKGELKSFAFVAEYVDGSVVDQVMYEDGANAYKLLGALETMKAKIIKRHFLHDV
jgi:hypothetical protein